MLHANRYNIIFCKCAIESMWSIESIISLLKFDNLHDRFANALFWSYVSSLKHSFSAQSVR